MHALLSGEPDTELARFRRGLEERGWLTTRAHWPTPPTEHAYDLAIIQTNRIESELQAALAALRASNKTVLIMVVGEFPVDDRIRALEFGADDVLECDTPVDLMMTRAFSLLPLRAKDFQSSYQIGDLSIDLLHRRVIRNGRNIALSQREYQLLVLLARQAGQTVPRSDIIDRLWGHAEHAGDNALDAHVSRLRRKLDKPFNQQLILTVRGVGFQLAMPAGAIPINQAAHSLYTLETGRQPLR